MRPARWLCSVDLVPRPSLARVQKEPRDDKLSKTPKLSPRPSLSLLREKTRLVFFLLLQHSEMKSGKESQCKVPMRIAAGDLFAFLLVFACILVGRKKMGGKQVRFFQFFGSSSKLPYSTFFATLRHAAAAAAPRLAVGCDSEKQFT